MPPPATDGGTTGTGGPGENFGTPPRPTRDGPDWFVTPDSITAGTLAIGHSYSLTIRIYNTSKKTPLQLTSITVQGSDSGDFILDAASQQSALGAALPPNQSAYTTITIAFMPSAEGPRSASVELVSNAGTVSVPLMGQGAPQRPVAVVTKGGIHFTPATAPYVLTLSNAGGEPLVLQSFAIAGQDAATFEQVPTNKGSGGCRAGDSLPLNSLCYIGIWYLPGSIGPKTADLVLETNDPVNPSIDVPITLSAK